MRRKARCGGAHALARRAMTAAEFGSTIPVAKNYLSISGFHNWGKIMSAHTYKIIELVGSSTEGTDQAIRDAIAKAALTVKHMDWYEVAESRGNIVDGKVSHYQVTIKVGFRLE